ncbi:heterocyst differentiation protein HetZ [Lyngbya sp. CCY1209]|uniref:heterocyst differentiation protein HetZ n=1 Tax=Lyngbya sp. CCY1209 TaxID=2886103 RepID=UPI002D2124D5|nr:heterocyst differentiation protein HetZ [Lyngbya sp. CCY1209]MEB3885792.1 heterocyst differentiation protein HetZ [Lyngbya sp. CCY1209]
MGEICQSHPIFQRLSGELKQATKASEQNCRDVAWRLTDEAIRICTESKRIQASGEVETWAMTLAQHRLQQCLRYYKLGSKQAPLELHSTLSAIVYRYITPPQVQSSYHARLELIRDFLQGFYVETLNAFRKEAQMPSDYRPQTLLELAEYLAFSERYGKRRIPLARGRSQQLIVLRSQTFSQQQPRESLVDLDKAAEGVSSDSDQTWDDSSLQQVRAAMVAESNEPELDSLRQTVVEELMQYLEEHNQQDCANYFTLRLQDLPTREIEAILGLTPRQRDYLQQRFKYHLLRFALGHRWELVHQWLEADLDRNLGLLPEQWENFQTQLGEGQQHLLRLKQQGLSDGAIAQKLGCKVTQVQKRWFKVLELAWDIRNRSVSGAGASSDE